jgi:hypothetical protein
MSGNIVHRTCGYQVLRKPHWNYDQLARGAFDAQPRQVGGLYYGGLDRMGWFDLDEHLHTGDLPSKYVSFRESLNDENRDFTGLYVCKSYKATAEVLSYIKSVDGDRNEIVSIYSELLEQIKGESAIHEHPDVQLLGYDFVVVGGWSLLYDGLFLEPNHFAHGIPMLNLQGLFSERLDLDDYFRFYNDAALLGLVEPMPTGNELVDAVAVHRVLDLM